MGLGYLDPPDDDHLGGGFPRIVGGGLIEGVRLDEEAFGRNNDQEEGQMESRADDDQQTSIDDGILISCMDDDDEQCRS